VPSYALNAVTAPDKPSQNATLQGSGFFSRVNLDVVNESIFWQLLQINNPGDPYRLATWQQPVQMIPGSRTLIRWGIVGVRFYAVIPAASLPAGTNQAIVTAELVQ